MGNDAERAEIVATGLDDYVGERRIFSGLPHFQVLFPFLIVSDVGSRNGRENFGKMPRFFYSKNEIRVFGTEEEIVVPVENGFGGGEKGNLASVRFSSDAFLEMAFRDAGFPNHAAGYAHADFFSNFLGEALYFARVAENAVFALLPDATGIEDYHVRFGGVENFSQPGLQKNHVDLFGVGIVHLAPEGLHVVGGGGCHVSRFQHQKRREVYMV